MSALTSAVSILKLFSAERPELSVTEAARLLGMPKSTASRLLKAMLREGLLANVGSSSRYRLGHLFFEISRRYRHNSSLMDLTDAALGAICRDTRHAGYISILEGSDVLVLRAILGTETLRVVTPLGSRSAAFATSTGRALLARLNDEEVRALHREPLAPPSPNAPQTLDDLFVRLDLIRRAGWCEAIDEAIPGVGSVSVGVRDEANSETVAFCVSFPAHLVSELERRRLAAMLMDAARGIALEVDDSFWTKPRSPREAA
jgi:IclR family transcriptional regulator, KDG regulon repressor